MTDKAVRLFQISLQTHHANCWFTVVHATVASEEGNEHHNCSTDDQNVNTCKHFLIDQCEDLHICHY